LRIVQEATITSGPLVAISGDPENFVRLQAQSPLRMGLAVRNRHLGIRCHCRTMHRLQQEVIEFQAFVQIGFGTVLRKDKLQFVAGANRQRCSRLWAHADPINTSRRDLSAIRLDRNFEAIGVKRVDESFVELKKRFASGTDN
jgi:hypothetical protein